MPIIDFEQSVSLIYDNEIVALPTETVYGLAGNALSINACSKIFAIKGRPLIDPLIVHILDIHHAEKIAEISPEARLLAQAFWPGPLTLIVQKKECIPDLITAGQKTVAIRSPAHPLFRKVLAVTQIPLAAPSANPFGYISPTLPQHIIQSFNDQLPVLDGGSCTHGLESTIIDIHDPKKPRILRPGPISPEAIEKVLKTKILQKSHSAEAPLLAPGMLSQHYSPHTPLQLQPLGSVIAHKDNVAFVHFQKPSIIHENTYWLSNNGSLEEVAHNLFSLLYQLDSKKYSEIIIYIPDNHSSANNHLLNAIIDRLQRAASKKHTL